MAVLTVELELCRLVPGDEYQRRYDEWCRSCDACLKRGELPGPQPDFVESRTSLTVSREFSADGLDEIAVRCAASGPYSVPGTYYDARGNEIRQAGFETERKVLSAAHRVVHDVLNEESLLREVRDSPDGSAANTLLRRAYLRISCGEYEVEVPVVDNRRLDSLAMEIREVGKPS